MNSVQSSKVYLCFSMLITLLAYGNVFAQGGRADNSVTYIDTSDKRNLNPTESENDAKELAKSIEFEVYRLTESGMSRAVYESPAGICQGYQGNAGVNFTNSTHHYIASNNKKEYYGSVTGANIYQYRSAENVSYVPVISVSNPELSRQIQIRENQNLRQKMTNHIGEARQMLDNVICQ